MPAPPGHAEALPAIPTNSDRGPSPTPTAIATVEDGTGRSQVADHLRLRRLLRRAALGGSAADHVIGELHMGHAVVLVEAAEIAASDAQARLEELAHAA